MLYRCCSKCKIHYPDTKEYFALDKRRKNGLSSQCRKCKYTYTLTWRRKNVKKCREYYRIYYQGNKEKEYGRCQGYSKTFRGYVCRLLANMKQRCTNKNNPRHNDYKNVQICFTHSELCNWFVENNINPRGLEIHRIKFNGDYSLDNIEFLTKSEHTTLHNTKGH